MNLDLKNYAVNNLKLDDKSRNFPFVLSRASKILSDLKIYESNIPKKITREYGHKQAAVAYTLLKIQKDAIKQEKNISMPSLLSLGIAFKCSITHVRSIINKLIDKKLLHIKSYWYIDKETGEVVTRKDKLSRMFKNTNGKLRKIINPFKGVKEYIQAKKSNRKAMIDEITLKSQFAIKLINDFYSGQKDFKDGIYEKYDVDPPIIMDNDRIDIAKDRQSANINDESWDDIINKLGGDI